MEDFKVGAIRGLEELAEVTNDSEAKALLDEAQEKLLQLPDNDNEQATEIVDEVSTEPAIHNLKAAAPKTSAERTGSSNSNNSGKVVELNRQGYEENVLNSTGTVYVEFGRGACGRCNKFKKGVNSNYAEISQYATVYSMNCDTNNKLYWELAKQTGGSPGILPMIVKFVDGKVVEQIPYNGNADKMKDMLINKAEPSKIEEPEDTEETNEDNKTGDAKAAKEVEKYTSKKELEEANLKKLNKELADIKHDKELKEFELEQKEKELEAKQKKYEDLMNRIDNASDDEDVSALQEEASTLSGEIRTIKSAIDSLKTNIASIDRKIITKQTEIRVQEQALKVASTKLDDAIKAADVKADEAENEDGKTNEPTVNPAHANLKRNKYGTYNVNPTSLENVMANSEGISYVVLGNLTGCHLCKNLANDMQDSIGDLEAAGINVYNMDWNDANSRYCWDLVYSLGYSKGKSIGFPVVVKFVDGKPVEYQVRPKDSYITDNLNS